MKNIESQSRKFTSPCTAWCPFTSTLDTDLSPLACFHNTWLFVHMGRAIFRLLRWKFSIEDYNLLLPAYLSWERFSVIRNPLSWSLLLLILGSKPGPCVQGHTQSLPLKHAFDSLLVERSPVVHAGLESLDSRDPPGRPPKSVRPQVPPLPPSLQDSASAEILQFLHSSCPGWAAILMIPGQILAARTPSRLQCREIGTGFNCALSNADQGRRLCSKHYICGKQPRI